MGGIVTGLVNTDRSFVRLATLCQSGPRAAGTAKPAGVRFAEMRRSGDAGPLCRNAPW